MIDTRTHRIHKQAVWLVATVALVWVACDAGGVSGDNRDTHCDDGTTPTCEMVPPTCQSYEILAHQNDCYVCVDPDTCEPWGGNHCTGDADCAEGQWCDPCGSSSCPMCADCVAACMPHNCPSDGPAVCYMERPECGEYGVAVVADGCWVCVDVQTCEPVRDDHCDDGTEPLCNMIPPVCAVDEILAHQNQCYVCVNPGTCQPWGEPGCAQDQDCGEADYCDPCASSSCPECDDCVAACAPHGCPTETDLLCFGIRPECGENGVAVIESGCWVCKDLQTCGEARDDQCDDGTEPICAMIPPVCLEDEILAHQNQCYVCVNPATCHPWGVPGCTVDADCAAVDACDPCGSSSCPGCEDCVPACLPHGCPTEPEAQCYMVRPDCEAGEVAVVQNACWVCVDEITCQ